MNSVLKGPADADQYRVKVGRFGDRFYTDPLPTCPIADASEWVGPSISATKPPFSNKYVPMKSIAEMSDAEWMRLSGLAVTDRYEAIKNHDKATSRVNMARGSLIHEWAEDLLYGRPMRFPLGYDQPVIDQAATFQSALQAFFDTHQPELVAAEVVCLHRHLNGVGYGGTADAFARIDGDVWIIDWKSRNSDHAAYLEEAAQGGGYAGAEYMIVTGDDGNPCRINVPDVAGVLIVSIRPDGFKAYPIDRDGAVRAYAAMHRWWVAQRGFVDDKVIGRPWAPKVSSVGGTGTNSQPASEVDPPADEFTITTTDGRRKPVTITYTREGIRARIAKLIENGHEGLVRSMWPVDVPPLSKPGHTVAQLTALMHMMMRAESETSAPFHPDDIPPRNPQPEPEPELPPAAELDEGGPITDEQKAALEVGFNALTEGQKMRLGLLTKEASDVGRSLSVSIHPTQRRWAIAQALIHWMAHGPAELHHLLVAATIVATDDQTADPNQTIGALISKFTIEQANCLHDSLDYHVAA
jgi:hypothetical protein